MFIIGETVMTAVVSILREIKDATEKQPSWENIYKIICRVK